MADIFLVIPMLLLFGALMYFVGYANGEMDGIVDARRATNVAKRLKDPLDNLADGTVNREPTSRGR